MSVHYLQSRDPAPAAIPGQRPFHLSPRQLEVLRLLGEGLSNKQIGRVLGITDGTVKQHTQCVLEELGAANRLQAVIYAYRQGILTYPAEDAVLPGVDPGASPGLGGFQAGSATP